MAELAVTAIGADRPGIVARVSGVLLEHGGNLEDASMTILRGHFAIMLLVTTDADPAALEAALADATADLDLVVTVRPVGEGADSPPPTHVVSVYGSDRPGIVHGVATVLAEHDVNVSDLTTRLIEGEHPVYAMMLEAAVPDAVDPDRLAEAVATRVDDVEVTIHPLEAETF
ncbi:MAG TPA: ACT domain-containing protein [Egibacteraceae bacterium]|nr:ACT domain-containing protein [Actinomycetota bacterium]HWB71531.1 ACT domain-containing protein [Egibacteraceae bacterium]